jgi:hypothetical protein
MKKIFSFCLIVFAALYFWAGCSEEPPPPAPKAQPAPKAPPAPKAQVTPQPQPAESETVKEWSFIEDNDSAVELADNFTAKNYFLIFDGSGSMKKSECSGGRRKIDAAKAAVVEWSKSVPSDANLGLYAFHTDRTSVLPLSAGSRDRFIQTVQNIEPGGKTPLSNALAYAYKAFTLQARRQLGYGEYTIVVVTDGIANNEQRLAQNVNTILASTPITIYSIGFCIGQNHSLNQPGRTIYKAADNPAELSKGLREVLAESETFDETEFNN